MTSKERVMTVLNGGTPDRVPALFTMHFPPKLHRGEAAVAAHARFFRESKSDIAKIMNENLLRSDITVQTPTDLARERLSTASRLGLDAQVELVRQVTERAAGDRLTLATIHGPMVSMHHMSGRRGFFVQNLDFYRACKEQDPAAMKDALARASDTLSELVRRCLTEGGADGIYFAALGAEQSLFTPEEYAEIVRPYDEQVLAAAKECGGVRLLHICKKGIDVRRFADYPAEIFNWEMTGANPSLEEGLSIVPADRTILGGFSNEHGPLLEGTEEALAVATRRLLHQVQGRRWILGAGCTLPQDIDLARLRTVVRTAETFAFSAQI